LCIFRGQI